MEIDEGKKQAAKKLIQKYYYQLTVGCGNPGCDNEHCASSGKVTKLSANQAAAQGLVLFTRKARLCDIDPGEAAMTYAMDHDIEGPTNINSKLLKNASVNDSDQYDRPLTESCLKRLVESCKESGKYSSLIRTLGRVFSDPHLLAGSFVTSVEGSVSEKEEIRSLETEKDEDTKSLNAMEVDEPSIYEITVDLNSLRRAYQSLMQIESDVYESALITAIRSLSDALIVDLQRSNGASTIPHVLNIFAILCDLPVIGQGEYLEQAVPAIAKVVVHLGLPAAAALAKFFSNQSVEYLKNLVQTLQQLVSLRVLSGNFSREILPNDDKEITACTKMLKVLYYANALAGCRGMKVCEEAVEELEKEDDWFIFARAVRPSERQVPSADLFGKELGVTINQCRRGLIPFTEFYNEPLSDMIEMDKEFSYFLALTNGEGEKFSFLRHGFILTTATKVVGLYYDNRIRMYSERRFSMMQSVMHGQPVNPYCVFKVRREHIVEDALLNVEMIAVESPDDLKKQLVVEFEGEQGVDEGGVSKEFFQLVIEQLFNPDFAMFQYRAESRTHWFNPTSFENDANFTLVGILFGLAIYNAIILEVRFPRVVYRKLLGVVGTFADLEDFDPVLHRTLKEMLDYPSDDFDDIFMQTFRVSYTDIFGSTLFHDLKPSGDEIPVTKENRQEFVDLYADFLLNGSIATQFKAFAKGFKLIASQSPLAHFFRPDELEELVCGSPEFDFGALETSTEYDNGFRRESQIIRDFWEIVHGLDDEGKRQFLQFTTGSDRVPVGGMSKLKLMIARNGPDTDRLPTAHTCFNVLLLPEYSSKEKLRDRLLKAVSYAKGFGLK